MISGSTKRAVVVCKMSKVNVQEVGGGMGDLSSDSSRLEIFRRVVISLIDPFAAHCFHGARAYTSERAVEMMAIFPFIEFTLTRGRERERERQRERERVSE